MPRLLQLAVKLVFQAPAVTIRGVVTAREPESIQRELLRLATQFRRAMQQSDNVPEGLRARFRLFPKDMCEFASNLLGRYLTGEGIADVRYVCGSRRLRARHNDQRHAWLEVQGFIIDITADQFPDGIGPIVVTGDRSWHSRFRIFESRDATNLTDYPVAARKQYDELFRRVVVPALCHVVKPDSWPT